MTNTPPAENQCVSIVLVWLTESSAEPTCTQSSERWMNIVNFATMSRLISPVNTRELKRSLQWFQVDIVHLTLTYEDAPVQKQHTHCKSGDSSAAFVRICCCFPPQPVSLTCALSAAIV